MLECNSNLPDSISDIGGQETTQVTSLRLVGNRCQRSHCVQKRNCRRRCAEAVMLRRQTLRRFVFLLSSLPVSMANSFINTPGVVRGDITGSAALEWTLDSEPGRDDLVGFAFNGADVFRYEPYTGVIPPSVVHGPGGNRNSSYDPRFSVYNTSTRGVGFRLAGLRPEDAGTYTCGYEALSAPITMDAVLFVYDVPSRPGIEASPQILVEGVTTVRLECGASSTSLPEANRPAMLYSWTRNWVDIDRAAPSDRHAVLGDSGRYLNISPVHHTDTTYTCTVSENGTQLTSEETEITLDVLHGPHKFTLSPTHPSARENEALYITASADCNPVCNFTWSIAGSSFASQGPVLRFDRLLARDAANYTVRVDNNYGTSELTVEVTLNGNLEVPEVPYLAIIGVITAIACVSITINVVIGTLAFRRGLFSCRKGNTEPGHPAAVYVNAGLAREPGNPGAGYVNAELIGGRGRSTGNQPSDTNAAYEDMNLTGSREQVHPADIEPEDTSDYMSMSSTGNLTYQRAGGMCESVYQRNTAPAHPTDMVREDGLGRAPVTSAEPSPPVIGGVYESVDQRTREPVRPADKVYDVLSDTPSDL